MIAGIYGGRGLVAPRGRTTRPTSERVREAVFAVLADVSGARVLDLFAGSGAMGIEALSRGARGARFVDSSRVAIAVVRRNLDALGIGGGVATVERRDALSALGAARHAGRKYDLVFVDPPYQRVGPLRNRLSEALVPVLADGARLIAESDRRSPLALELPRIDSRIYGDTMIEIHTSP